VLGTGWTQVVALAAACLIAVLATPAGASGAVLLEAKDGCSFTSVQGSSAPSASLA
jgi:hypothetical protein